MSDLRFKKPASIIGTNIRFRQVDPQDAEFVLSLRLDGNKNQYISETDPDVDRQAHWIHKAQRDPRQCYFLIEDSDKNAVGTVRLYDPKGTSFCWGSWILSDQKPRSAAVESTLMVYAYGLFCGFDRSHFDVRKENVKVWQYHERMGALRVGEDGPDYLYEMGNDAIHQMFSRYKARVGNRIIVGLGTTGGKNELDLDTIKWQIVADDTAV